MITEEDKKLAQEIHTSETPWKMKHKVLQLEAKMWDVIHKKNMTHREAQSFFEKELPETKMFMSCSPLCECHLNIKKRGPKNFQFVCHSCPLLRIQKTSCQNPHSLYVKWTRTGKKAELRKELATQIRDGLTKALEKYDAKTSPEAGKEAS